MNAIFIYLIVALTAIFCSSLFQSKLNQPLLLKQLYSIDLIILNDSSHISEMKVAKLLNIFKSSRNIFIKTYKSPQRLVRR